MWLPDGEYDVANYGTRWYYQEPIYTYYYKKTEAKEATTDPTGQSNVSNVQKWVKYRLKNNDSQPTTPEPTAKVLYYHYYKQNGGSHMYCPTDHAGGVLHQILVSDSEMNYDKQSSCGNVPLYSGPTCSECGVKYWFKSEG